MSLNAPPPPPGATTTTVPILDFGPYLDERTGQADRAVQLEKLAEELKKASLEVGFYFITGADALVPEPMVKEMFEVARKFHDLDEATKMRHALDPRTQKGYMPNYADLENPSSSLKEGDSNAMKLMTARNAFNAAFFASKSTKDGVLGGPEADLRHNPWPDDVLPEMQQTCTRYEECMSRLRSKMLPVYARALGMPLEELERLFREHATIQYRLTHYPETPPSPKGGEIYGFYPHVDTDFFTVLAPNEVPGLSLRLRDGQWLPVQEMPKTFLVNTGEILHRLTNGKWLNTFHRVDNRSGRERYAVVSFVSLDKNARITPIIEPGDKPLWGTSFTAKEIYLDVMNNPKGLSAVGDEYLGAKL